MHRVGIIEPVGGYGGMDYYIYGLSENLGELGVPVNVYTCSNTENRKKDNVNILYTFGNIWHGNKLLKGAKYIIGYILSIIHAKFSKISILHVHIFHFRYVDILIFGIAKIFGFRIVATMHDIKPFHINKNRTVDSICNFFIDGVIVHNKTSLNLYKSFFSEKKMISVIPHGNYFPFVDVVKSKNAENEFNILFFGQIKDVKGLDLLLKAVKDLKSFNYNVKLIIAGRPYKSDVGKYLGLIKDLSIENVVEFNFSYIPNNEVKYYFSRADLVVLPYREIYQSGVLLLTITYGVPVLCSNLAAFCEIIKDGENGFLFENGSVEDLGSKINFIIKNKNILAKISRNADKYIRENHDWRVIASMTLKFYEEIL